MSTDQPAAQTPQSSPVVPPPQQTTLQPAATQTKQFKTAFIISLVTNLALAGLLVWCSIRWEARYKEGYYQGQLKTYTQLEMWGLGKVMATGSELQFKLSTKPITVQVYNRNYRPQETDRVQEGLK